MKLMMASVLACGMYLNNPSGSVIAGDAAVPIDARACEARPTDIPAAVDAWRTAWANRDPATDSGHGKGSWQSNYENLSRFAEIAYLRNLPVDTAVGILNQAVHEGPLVEKDWNRQDYARLGEAALVTKKSVGDAVAFLRKVWAAPPGARFLTWSYYDYARVAKAGFVMDYTPEDVRQTLEAVKSAERRSWQSGALSMIAEAALLKNIPPETAVQTLDDVYDEALKVAPSWYDGDYARIARAALLKGVDARTAAKTLDETWRATKVVAKDWPALYHSRLASAVILSGKTADEAARTVEIVLHEQALAPNFSRADYAMLAATALLGPGKAGAPGCPTLD